MEARSPIKLLSIVPYRFLPARTGGQIAIAFFNKYLSRRVGLYCATVKTNSNDVAEYPVFSVFSNKKFRYADIRNFFKLRKYIREQQITHIIMEHPYLGWLGVLLKKSCDIKLAVRSHNIEGVRWKQFGKWWWWILYRYEKWVHRRADFNLFITDEDKEYAIKNFSLSPERCTTVTFGTEMQTVPSDEERVNAREHLEKKHGISTDETIILFNGAFNYKPNLDALLHLLKEVNPILSGSENFSYKLIICGKDLPPDILTQSYPQVIFAGFVDDLLPYLKGSDIFVNPVVAGGGIKTKLVEALAYNLSCVSYTNGAIGVPADVTGDKLTIVENYNHVDFAQAILRASETKNTKTPPTFFDRFYWGNVIERCVQFLSQS